MDSENLAPSSFDQIPNKNHGFSKGAKDGQRKALCPVSQAELNELALKKKKDVLSLKGEQDGTLKPLVNNVQCQPKLAKPAPGPSANFSIFCDESFESLPDHQSHDLITDDDEDEENKLNDTHDDHFNVVTAQDPALKEILDTSNLVLPDLDSPVMSADVSMEPSPTCNDSSIPNEDSLLSCPEYRESILRYMLKLEKKFLPDPDYMGFQSEINHKMRSILVDWMVEVTEEYKLSDETLFLAIAYVDRYLSTTPIERQTFQLLGTSCLFIAAKYEEIYPPDVNEFVYVTDDSYSKSQVLQMEMKILKTLGMNVSTPTAHYFLLKYLDNIMISSNVQNLAEFYCYLALLEGQQYLKYCPSEISLASVILAAHTLKEGDFVNSAHICQIISLQSAMLEVDTLQVRHRLNECMAALLESHSNAANCAQAAIYTRYSSSKHLHVATTQPLTTVPLL